MSRHVWVLESGCVCLVCGVRWLFWTGAARAVPCRTVCVPCVFCARVLFFLFTPFSAIFSVDARTTTHLSACAGVCRVCETAFFGVVRMTQFGCVRVCWRWRFDERVCIRSLTLSFRSFSLSHAFLFPFHPACEKRKPLRSLTLFLFFSLHSPLIHSHAHSHSFPIYYGWC